MTDENQNAAESGTTETAPQFGSSNNDQTATPAQFSKDDIERILKINKDSQDFISQLKSETADLRNEIKTLQQDVANSKTIDELLEGMATSTTDANEPGPKTPPLDQDKLLSELETRVFNKLSNQERIAQEQKNWDDTERQLKAKHGEGYASYVDARAAQLDMTNDQMERLARTSPKAFMEIVSSGSTTASQPTISSTSTGIAVGEEDFEATYRRIAALKFENSPEGRDAKRLYDSAEFQQKFRQHILDKHNK
jgi:hypothetical protein